MQGEHLGLALASHNVYTANRSILIWRADILHSGAVPKKRHWRFAAFRVAVFLFVLFAAITTDVATHIRPAEAHHEPAFNNRSSQIWRQGLDLREHFASPSINNLGDTILLGKKENEDGTEQEGYFLSPQMELFPIDTHIGVAILPFELALDPEAILPSDVDWPRLGGQLNDLGQIGFAATAVVFDPEEPARSCYTELYIYRDSAQVIQPSYQTFGSIALTTGVFALGSDGSTRFAVSIWDKDPRMCPSDEPPDVPALLLGYGIRSSSTILYQGQFPIGAISFNDDGQMAHVEGCNSIKLDGAAVVTSGQATPNGGQFSCFRDVSLDNVGGLVFSATLTGGSSDGGIFRLSDGIIETVVENGDSAGPVHSKHCNVARTVSHNDEGLLVISAAIQQHNCSYSGVRGLQVFDLTPRHTDFSIEITPSPSVASPGDVLTIAIDVRNEGPDDVVDVPHFFASFVRFSWVGRGIELLPDDCRTGGTTIRLALDAGQSFHCTLLVRVLDEAKLVVPFIAWVSCCGGSKDPDPSNNRDDITINVRPTDVAVQIETLEEVVSPGDELKYRIEVTNKGPARLLGEPSRSGRPFDRFRVGAYLPAGVTFIESEDCDVSYEADVHWWEAAVDPLEPGESFVCHITTQVDEDAEPELVSTAYALLPNRADERDPDWTNNVDTVVTQVAKQFTINVSTFIPGNHVVGPPQAFCLNFSEPRAGIWKQLFFAGDNRSFSATAGSYKTRQLVTVVAKEAADEDGIKDDTTPANLVGETKAYASDALEDGSIDAADDDGVLNDCHLLHDRGRASNASMRISVTRIDAHKVSAHLFGGAANPLVIGAPAIDWDFTITLDTSGSQPQWTLQGAHDSFPAYEIYINNVSIYAFDPGPPPYTLVDHLGGLFPPLDISVDPLSGHLFP